MIVGIFRPQIVLFKHQFLMVGKRTFAVCPLIFFTSSSTQISHGAILLAKLQSLDPLALLFYRVIHFAIAQTVP